jgi:hypothetical protein
MLCFPYTELLGWLRLIETYVYYDGPVLFACRNTRDQTFVAVWLDDSDETNEWLLAPTSAARFAAVRSRQLDLRTVFARPEDGIVFRLAVSKVTQQAAVIMLPASELSDEQLPAEGEYVGAARDVLAEVTQPRPSTEAVAAQVWRPVLDVHLQLPIRYGYRAPVRWLASLLAPLQETFDAMVYGSAVSEKKRWSLPSDLLMHTEMALQSNYSGSVGLVLAASEQADLFGQSVVAAALDRFLLLLDCGSDEERLRGILQTVHRRAATRYGLVLAALVRANADLDAAWSSPDAAEKRSAHLSATVARDALEIVNRLVVQLPEEISVLGTLVGLNVRTKTYEITEVTTGKKYSGRIADEALPLVEHATISDKYIARISKVTELLPTTGHENIIWQLIALYRPDEAPAPEG